MNMYQRGKVLPVLLGVLVIAMIAGAAIYLPQYMNQKKLDDLSARMTVRSAFMRAVTEIEDKTKKWPKNAEEIIAAKPKALAEVSESQARQVTYEFVEIKDRMAVYRYKVLGREGTVKILPKSLQLDKPLSAGVAAG
jgi:hypothetical protein